MAKMQEPITAAGGYIPTRPEQTVPKVYTAYVAGPMTGLPNDNYDQFHEVAVLVRINGLPGRDLSWPLRVIDPALNFGEQHDKPRRVYLAKAMQQVTEADALVLLPKWWESEGAQLEVSLALDLGKDFYVAWQRSSDSGWEIGATSAVIVQTILEELADTKPELAVVHTKYGPVYIEPDRRTINSVRADIGLPEYEPEPLEAPEAIEEEAGRLVRQGARQQTYGHPRGDFDRVALMWQAILGIPITAEQVAIMMVAFKLARLSQTPQHRDSKVDVIGYTICLDRLDESDAQAA